MAKNQASMIPVRYTYSMNLIRCLALTNVIYPLLAKYSRNKFKKCLTISFERGNIISDSKGCAVLQDITRLVSCRDCTNVIQKG